MVCAEVAGSNKVCAASCPPLSTKRRVLASPKRPTKKIQARELQAGAAFAARAGLLAFGAFHPVFSPPLRRRLRVPSSFPCLRHVRNTSYSTPPREEGLGNNNVFVHTPRPGATASAVGPLGGSRALGWQLAGMSSHIITYRPHLMMWS